MEVFFSRPGKKGEIKERIITDIKYARKRVLISVFSFTSQEIAKVINESQAFDKRIVYDKDVNLRKTTTNVPLITDENFIKENCAMLGYEYSKMHHKFIIVDDVLWTGTYNLSFNAHSNNWENMMRITDKNVVRKFVEEFDKMFVFSKGIDFNELLIGTKCKTCDDDGIIEDPFEHFRVVYRTLYFTNVTIKNGSASNYDEENIINNDKDLKLFNVSFTKNSGYRAFCLKDDNKDSIWMECCRCKEKGFRAHMHVVSDGMKIEVKKENEAEWTQFREGKIQPLKSLPTRYACLECLHSVIIESSKMNTPDIKMEIPFTEAEKSD